MATIKLESINDSWEIDAKIDPIDITHESLRSPALHAKYIRMLTQARMERRKAEIKYQKVRNCAVKYYKGELGKETLEALGWKQYLGPKILKSEIDVILLSDDNVIAEQNKYEYYNTMVIQLESILKAIGSRSFDIRNAITWEQYKNGAN